MEDGFQQAEGIFGRCQTCIKNMQKSICSFTCAPDQSRFMKPEIYDSWDGTGMCDFLVIFLVIFTRKFFLNSEIR